MDGYIQHICVIYTHTLLMIYRLLLLLLLYYFLSLVWYMQNNRTFRITLKSTKIKERRKKATTTIDNSIKRNASKNMYAERNACGLCCVFLCVFFLFSIWTYLEYLIFCIVSPNLLLCSFFPLFPFAFHMNTCIYFFFLLLYSI